MSPDEIWFGLLVLFMYDEIGILNDGFRRTLCHPIDVIVHGSVGPRKRRDVMKIRINKWFGAPLSDKVPAHANRELVREAELARERAWRYAFLIGGGVG